MSKIYEALQLEQSKKNEGFHHHHEIQPIHSDYDQSAVWYGTDPQIDEEYINLYYTVHALLGQKSGKVVQFISSSEGDGTSTVSEQFGRVSTSGLGKSVLLIRTQSHGHSGTPANQDTEEKTIERLGKGASVEEVFSNHGEPGFFVWSLTNPLSAQTLRSPDHFEIVLSRLREHFDLILIDLPALSSSPLGLAVCGLADGIILVVEAEKTKAGAALKAKQRIQRAGGNILGVVLNKHRSHIPNHIDVPL